MGERIRYPLSGTPGVGGRVGGACSLCWCKTGVPVPDRAESLRDHMR